MTHFIGVDMRCVLPKDLHVYQRTVYAAVVEFAARPFMQLAGEGERDGDQQFRGVVMVARCEALAWEGGPAAAAGAETEASAAGGSSAASASSPAGAGAGASSASQTPGGAAARDGLGAFFKVLNSRKRVGFCQTLDNNHQCYIVPRPSEGGGGGGGGGRARARAPPRAAPAPAPAAT